MNEQEKLNILAKDFNPFSQEVSPELMKIIKSLGLEEFLENPFDFSNQILKRLHAFDEVSSKDNANSQKKRTLQ